jgi:hypothetical protein
MVPPEASPSSDRNDVRSRQIREAIAKGIGKDIIERLWKGWKGPKGPVPSTERDPPLVIGSGPVQDGPRKANSKRRAIALSSVGTP